MLFRAPILLYRLRLGFLLGTRFIMLEHIGRKSGRKRRTVLEVVVNDPDAVYVAAAWGSKSQWYNNIKADPSVVFYLGSKRYESSAEDVLVSRARQLMDRYAVAHPVALDKLAGFMLDDPADSTDEQARQVAENVPFVRLPKGGGQ